MLFLMYVIPYVNLSLKEALILSWTDNQKLHPFVGAQWLSGRVLDSRPKGREFELRCVLEQEH